MQIKRAPVFPGALVNLFLLLLSVLTENFPKMNAQERAAANNLAAGRAVEDSDIRQSFCVLYVKLFLCFKYICKLFVRSTVFYGYLQK